MRVPEAATYYPIDSLPPEQQLLIGIDRVLQTKGVTVPQEFIDQKKAEIDYEIFGLEHARAIIAEATALSGRKMRKSTIERALAEATSYDLTPEEQAIYIDPPELEKDFSFQNDNILKRIIRNHPRFAIRALFALGILGGAGSIVHNTVQSIHAAESSLPYSVPSNEIIDPTSNYTWPGGAYFSTRTWTPQTLNNIRDIMPIIRAVTQINNFDATVAPYGIDNSALLVVAHALVESNGINTIGDAGDSGRWQALPSDCPFDAQTCADWVTFPGRPTVAQLTDDAFAANWVVQHLQGFIARGADLRGAYRMYHHNSPRGDEYAQMVFNVYSWLRAAQQPRI